MARAMSLFREFEGSATQAIAALIDEDSKQLSDDDWPANRHVSRLDSNVAFTRPRGVGHLGEDTPWLEPEYRTPNRT